MKRNYGMRSFFILTVLFLTEALALGQGIPTPFDVGLGVRALGLGGAYTAVAEGTEALLSNPAGLAWQPSIRVDSSYTGAMGLYSTTWFAGALPNLGVGIAYLSAGDITNPAGDPLTFSHGAILLGGGVDLADIPFLSGFSRAPFDLALGAAVKLDRMRAATETTSGLALDLGAIANLDTPFGSMRAGFVLHDLGWGLSLGEGSDGWTSAIHLGLAWKHPSGVLATLDVSPEVTGFGVEWSFRQLLEFRGGVQSQGGAVRWSLGLGVHWQSFVLDYALTSHPFLGPSHRLGFGIELGRLLGW